MKKLKRLLLRPSYAIYWLKFKTKELLKDDSRFEKRIIEDTLCNYEQIIGLRKFNSWLSKKGYWRLDNSLEGLKLIIPKNYSDLIKKYPKLPYVKYDLQDRVNNKTAYYEWKAKSPSTTKPTT